MSCFLLPEEYFRQSFEMRIRCHKLSPDSRSGGIDDGIRHGEFVAYGKVGGR